VRVNPEGEYKVTRGRYYTVSGRTPQLTGVKSDIEILGPLAFIDIGESFQKHPLQPDQIDPNYEDTLSDVPFMQRARVAKLYLYDLQPRLDIYNRYLDRLRKNSEVRLAGDKGYQEFLKEVKNKEKEKELDESMITDKTVMSDFQLNEAYNVMRDLILLMKVEN
jgi:carboxyl-terminal processing protease